MTAELSGRNALVTGGTSGIGRATAISLARLGARVAVAGRDKRRGDDVVNEITVAGGEAVFIQAELNDASSACALAIHANEQLGHVDILVNTAGIYPFGPTSAITEDDFDSAVNLNMRALFFLVARLAPEMAERGHGAIVNLSTMMADQGYVGTSLYGATKAAVVSMTKSWAAEFGPHGVRVNAVAPGPTRTEGTKMMGDALDQYAALAPAGRPATADEIAEAIVFLASDRASFIHGAVLPADGGRTAV
jgi:NAD(P)-dependent dehydrogenase (short-subunit alcohol dehydrogenase family)